MKSINYSPFLLVIRPAARALYGILQPNKRYAARPVLPLLPATAPVSVRFHPGGTRRNSSHRATPDEVSLPGDRTQDTDRSRHPTPLRVKPGAIGETLARFPRLLLAGEWPEST